MATWHQQRAMRRGGVRLYHETMWSVVSDPPGGMTCSYLEPTKEAAEERLRVWETNRPGSTRHCYILAPASPEVTT